MDLYERANMIVASVPCPPLPMLGVRGDGDAEDAVFISHDLLRTMFINMLTCASVESRQQMMAKTAEADAELFAALAGGGDAYDSFCNYMRRVLRSHEASCGDIRFKNQDYVAVGDKVHKSTCSHLRGHDHMYDLPKNNIAYEKLRYSDLVQLYAARLRV